MKLSSDSINAFSTIILGNTGLTRSLNKSEINELFKIAGIKKVSLDKFFVDYPEIKNHPQYKFEKFKLEKYVVISLKNINFTHKIYQVVNTYFSQLYNYTSSVEEVLAYINSEFTKDNYEVVQMEETEESINEIKMLRNQKIK